MPSTAALPSAAGPARFPEDASMPPLIQSWRDVYGLVFVLAVMLAAFMVPAL